MAQKFVLYKKDGGRVTGDIETLADNICASLNLPPNSIEVTATKDPSKIFSDGTDESLLGAVLVVDKICGGCGKYAKKRCGNCQLQYYCSKECQRVHWKTHEPKCKKQI